MQYKSYQVSPITSNYLKKYWATKTPEELLSCKQLSVHHGVQLTARRIPVVWFSASSLSAGNCSAAAQQGTLCWPLFTSLPDPEDVTGVRKTGPMM